MKTTGALLIGWGMLVLVAILGDGCTSATPPSGRTVCRAAQTVCAAVNAACGTAGGNEP